MNRGGIGYRRQIPDYKVISRCERLKNPTPAEVKLFAELQRFRCLGFIFRRERMVLGWCLDFYCAKRRLAVEVDGGYHTERKEQDAHRDFVLHKTLGINTLRFTNEQVLNRTEQTVSRILAEVQRRPVYRSWNQGISIRGRRNADDSRAHERRAVTLAGKAATVATKSRAT